ncbi:MAG: ROK family protein [Limisphaerales bacterium]
MNDLLAKVGSPKRYRNLLGVTLGTGFGGGIVQDGKLFTGDNSVAGEIWALRNKLQSGIARKKARASARCGVFMRNTPAFLLRNHPIPK